MMKSVQPSSIKSECPKKQVKRPPACKKVERRPQWDNSLYRPSERPKVKRRPGSGTEKADADIVYGMSTGQPKNCEDRGRYVITREERQTNRRPKVPNVVCGRYPCAHPRFPQCENNVCFPIQCFRMGPDEDMICRICLPYEPPGRSVFCHPICGDDNDEEE